MQKQYRILEKRDLRLFTDGFTVTKDEFTQTISGKLFILNNRKMKHRLLISPRNGRLASNGWYIMDYSPAEPILLAESSENAARPPQWLFSFSGGLFGTLLPSVFAL